MENLIDSSYFWGELEIDSLFTNQASGIPLTEAGNNSASELDRYIAKYQKYYLEQMFGETLAANLPSELIDLIRDEQLKTSPIANCVYYFYMRANQSKTTGAGEVKMDIIRTRAVSASEKMCRAWNEMAMANRKIHEKLFENKTISIVVGEGEEQETVTLTYLDDIYPEICLSDNIFCTINSHNI